MVGASSTPLALQEISSLAEIHKSTTLRLLAHLEAEQYLSRDTRGGYSLGLKFLQPRGQAGAHTRLRDAARRSLWELWRRTKETVNLGVLDGLDVLYLDCLESPQSFRLVASIGTRAAHYRTALGKAMLAYLPSDRRKLLLKSTRFEAFTPNTITSASRLEAELEAVRLAGYALDDEESLTGVRCVGAPVLDAGHQPVAAVSISGPATRIGPENIAELGEAVLGTTEEVSRRLISAR